MATAVVAWGPCDIRALDADSWQLTVSRDAGCAFWWRREENREGGREVSALAKPLTGHPLQDVSCPQHIPSIPSACILRVLSPAQRAEGKTVVLRLLTGFCAVQVYGSRSGSSVCCLSTTHSDPSFTG